MALRVSDGEAAVMRHKWDLEREQRLAADCFADGCGRTIRVCARCGVKKKTVHPPSAQPWDIWHEWETADGETRWRSEMTPPCFGKKVNVKNVRKLSEVADGGC
jgi:hypothetical protein